MSSAGNNFLELGHTGIALPAKELLAKSVLALIIQDRKEKWEWYESGYKAALLLLRVHERFPDLVQC